MGLKKNQGPLSLFDIRLKTTERDAIVVRGTPEDATSVFMSGIIVLALAEPMQIKRITLKLQGTLRLHWSDRITTSRGQVSRPVKYEKVLYEHEWPNFLENSSLPSSSQASRSISSVSLASLGHGHSRSMGNLSALTSSSSSATVKLQGNYEFPFEIILPGDIPETIEGMDGGQMIYRLSATIERGKFANNIHCKKYIRILRTIGFDSFELSQTVSIENTWPNKVDYAISVPSKAVAIGSRVPVDLVFQPLLKGLKLGQIKVQLAEFIQLATPAGQTTTKDRIAHGFIIPAPQQDTVGLDSWEVHEMVPLPTSLTKCTQDTSLGTYIKVAHKLKFSVSLINPDGHTSELRASVPLYLFISPSVTITTANPTAIVVPGSSSNVEDTLFGSSTSEPSSLTGSSVNLSGLNGATVISSDASLADSNAPPNYQNHIYDRLYSDTPSITSSPETSGSSTPYIASRRNSNGESDAPLGMTTMPADERSQLAAGLRALALAQNRDSQISPVSPRPISGVTTPYPPPLHGSTSHANSTDYFSQSPTVGSSVFLSRQGFSSPDLMHMSRVGTPAASSGSTPIVEPINLESLSRVPSYTTALQGVDTSDTELAPGYDNNGNVSPARSPMPAPIIPSPPSAHTRQLGDPSRTSSSSGLSSLLGRTHSSRSLFGEASRLVRLTGSHDNNK